MRSSRFERSGGTGRELPIGASILPSGTLLHGRTRALYGSAPLARKNATFFRQLISSSSNGKTHLKVKCSNATSVLPLQLLQHRFSRAMCAAPYFTRIGACGGRLTVSGQNRHP